MDGGENEVGTTADAVPDPSADSVLFPYDPTYRFGLTPLLRLPMIMFAVSTYTVPMGLYKGGRVAGLRYLAENTHRLPQTQQGWYFYHKTKNYVVMRDAIIESARYTARVGAFTGLLFGTEAALDAARGRIDFANTTVAAAVVGLIHSWAGKLSRAQSRSSVRMGARAGLAFGLCQDGVRYLNGYDVWYVDEVRHMLE
ncbi:uncharacterized protein V1510DRAFT_403028 [Dipodascopsis tothii]|uniref:uncharacterized protein n=1 Tax=Dipodascopsis tothii TaxID=44089 RepID=UPI0034CD59C6